MNIALLFNWRAYGHVSNYWHTTRELVFAPGLIQRSGRHMKLSVGDVFVGHERGADGDGLYRAAFNSSEFRLVHDQRLADAFAPPTVFAMVFENMPRALATELHEAISQDPGYLGAISVHFEFGPHLALYRGRLPSEYRLHGQALRGFYAMGSDDGCDDFDLKEMERFGYTDLGWEDRGAGRTILDDFDTVRHFERVAAFRKLLTTAQPDSEDQAYELTMLLEDLSPKLFNALGSAAERLATAETEEDVAQVALSGRRYLEQLVDALFPARDVKRNGRALNQEAYRNRLWAFVEDNTTDPAMLTGIGAEIDRVVAELNGGVHAGRAQERIKTGIADAARLTAQLFSLNPAAARHPYLAYTESIRAFMLKALSRQTDTPEAS